MASQDRQHGDDVDRVLIRPSDCSTLVVKKSSVGHVPHEPSKGAVGRDVCHSACTSTAAHGGHRVTARTNESKAKQSVPTRLSDALCSVVQKDVVQLSLTSHERVPHVTANGICKSTVDDFRARSDRVSRRADIAQTLKSIGLHESPSAASLGDLVEDSSSATLFPPTLLNYAGADNSAPASTSENVQMLESEVVSLKEQLVVQSKVSEMMV